KVAGYAPVGVGRETGLSKVLDLAVSLEIEEQKWYQKYADDERVLKLEATSAAMDGRVVPLAIIPAGKPDRPTIYLLNGAGSAEQDTDWLNQSEAVDFYADKDVKIGRASCRERE